MNKKYGFIFLGLGLLLIILFALYNYTDLFIKSDPKKDDNPKEIITDVVEYDYIKSYDITKKIKLTFGVIKDLVVSEKFNMEFYRYYSNADDTISFSATMIKKNTKVETYANEQIKIYQEQEEKNGYTVTNQNIDCKYLCKKIKLVNDIETIYETRIYIQVSDNDIAEIKYQVKNQDISIDTINKIIDNIKMTNDATYKISNVDGNNLIVPLKSDDENVTVTLNSEIYEEIEDGLNNVNRTTIKNKNNNSVVRLIARSKVMASTIEEEVDMYHNMTDPGSNRKEIKLNDKVFYEYTIENHRNYAYIINDNLAIIIEPDNNDTFNLNDFTNIK